MINFPETVEDRFKNLFNEQPVLVRSPGRANLIGEHTDYNMGFVLPCTIDKAIYFAVTPRQDRYCKLYALNMDESFETSIDNLKKSKKEWPNYLMGVLDQLNKAGSKFDGFNCVFGGDIPVGAGLSSSAALEAGLAFTLNHIFDLHIDKLSLVKLAQKAENEFVGVQCGIMDQFINIFGESGTVLRIDCRSLEHRYFPFDFDDVSILLINSNVSHSLASSQYNQRRIECAEGVNHIKKYEGQVESLRDVSIDMLNGFKSTLDPTVYRRCKYVIEENDRLLQACSALEKKDLTTFGRIMVNAHDGLSRDYEVSCRELDYLVDLVRDNPHVYGSRMMGGGFGGCTINLVEPGSIDEVVKMVSEKYSEKFNIETSTYITSISSGTSIIGVNESAKV
ncbi:MAG: galactokinase [Bacteroidota bacterium]